MRNQNLKFLNILLASSKHPSIMQLYYEKNLSFFFLVYNVSLTCRVVLLILVTSEFWGLKITAYYCPG